MGKNLDMTSMDNLMSGLIKDKDTKKTVEEVPSAVTDKVTTEPHPKSKAKMERVCTLVESESMNKVRAIAEQENVAIKDLFALGLSYVINKYEELHGKIRVKRAKKGNVDEIFAK